MIATSWLAPACLQEKQEESIREATRAGLDWTEYLRLVKRHRTPALSWAALSRVVGLEIPAPAKQRLQTHSDACRMLAVKNSMLLAVVLKCFNRAAIPVMTFKGPTLSSDLYGDVGLRHSRDLDLAVPPADSQRAKACLENMGWRVEPTWFPLTPSQWESLLRHEHHFSFGHPEGTGLVELHWRNQWDPPGSDGDYWLRSIPSVWQGCAYQAMNPVDQIVYLCHHGASHVWFRAKWLGDIARIYAGERVDWEAVLSEARSAGKDRAVLACLRLLELLYGLPLPNLPGNPWKALPSRLIDAPLHALQAPPELEPTVSVASIPRWLRKSLYEMQLLPQKPWWEPLFRIWYRREDFRVFHLPDRFFWAYAALRPVFWVWRWVRRGLAVHD
jgi:hypothetical protein